MRGHGGGSLVKRAHRGKNLLHRHGQLRAPRLAQCRLIPHRGPVGCPGGENGAFDFRLQARMTRNVEGMQETGKWLRHGLNSFPWVAPFSSAGCATRAQIFGARTSRVKRKSRSEEHTSELQSLMRISYDGFC